MENEPDVKVVACVTFSSDATSNLPNNTITYSKYY